MNALSIPSKKNLNSSPFPITLRPFPSFSAVPTCRSHFTVTFPPMRSQNSLDTKVLFTRFPVSTRANPKISRLNHLNRAYAVLPLSLTILFVRAILCSISTSHLSRICGLRQSVSIGLNNRTFRASFSFILVS